MEISLTPLSARQASAIEFLITHGQVKLKDLLLGVSEDTALRDVTDLIDRKLVLRSGLARRTRYSLDSNAFITSISKIGAIQ